MFKTSGFLSLGFWFFIFIGFPFYLSAQVVNQKSIVSQIEDGNIKKASETLERYLGGQFNLTRQDSIFIYKNLGVIKCSQASSQALGEEYFQSLLEIDPQENLNDTYASHSILEIFKRVKKNYQSEHGGKSLVPIVVVMDINAPSIKEADRVALTLQFISSLRTLPIFQVKDREEMVAQLSKLRLSQKNCNNETCFLNLARQLLSDKLILFDLVQVAGVFTLNLKYIDVETGYLESTLQKNYKGELSDMSLNALPELANDLEKERAAWLNLSLQPKNATILVDGIEHSGMTTRLPLNPGKHQVCARARGYEELCREVSIEKSDALTYSFILKAEPIVEEHKATGLRNQKKAKTLDDDVEEAPSSEGNATVWWILGGLGVASLLFAVLFNSPG